MLSYNTQTYASTVVLLVLSTVSCQLSPEDVEKIDSFMEEVMTCRQMPGAAITLMKDNQVALTRGYGFANLEAQEPVTANTVFNIGSVTKSFAATLLSKLFSNPDSSVNWDSVAGWASDEVLHLYNGYVTNNTMFRDLMSHQTGLPRYDVVWAVDALDSRAELVERSRFFEPRWEFRSELIYNNNMYTFATYAVERLMSATFEDLMREQLLVPIGMESTVFYHEAAEEYEGFATPYVWDTSLGGNSENLTELPFETFSGIHLASPAGAVCSTANNMGDWLRFILNAGIGADGSEIMDPDALDRLWYPEAAYNSVGWDRIFGQPNAPVTYSMDGYGLGYFSGRYRGYKTWHHGGDLTGFHSNVFFMPDMDIASFFTTNFGGHSLERDYATQFFADILLGLEPAYNGSMVCQLLEEIVDGNLSNDNSIKANREKLHSIVNQDSSSEIGIPKPLAVQLSDEIKSIKLNSEVINYLNLDNYTGNYGSFAIGNIEVSLSEACDNCLFMEYGKRGLYTLYPTEVENVCYGLNEYIVYSGIPVAFSGVDEESGKTRYVTALFTPSLEPTFERGLTLDDAPPPDIDLCS